ncbi:MAG TPA: DinB family protein [Terriglobales bacterium]|nr:DinB family protein [Terriglobales bacterium]
MRRTASSSTTRVHDAVVETYMVNERMNQIILNQLDPRAWRAKAHGRNARTIAAIFAHVHNIRLKWIRLSAPHIKSPRKLDRTSCSIRQASTALAESAESCGTMLAQAFSASEPRVKQFLRDGWSTPWPAGASMFAYMISHEAHHRGQVCMLAHQLGFPLGNKATSEMWCWERLWKECGFGTIR